MIKIELSNGKKYIWDYKQLWEDVKLVIGIAIFLVVYMAISTIDYNILYK